MVKLKNLKGVNIGGDIVVISYVGTNPSISNKQYDGGWDVCGCAEWLELNGGMGKLPDELLELTVVDISMEEGCMAVSTLVHNLYDQVDSQYGDGMYERDNCTVTISGDEYKDLVDGTSRQCDRIVIQVTD